MTDKKATSYRLTETARLILDKMAKKMGVSRTDVIEIALRKLAETEGIEIVEQK